MSDFDLIFALLSLLLGLSIAELLAGFARVLRLKARQRAVAKGAVRVDEADHAPLPVRVGYLVPLLGAYVLIDQLSFFTAAFAYRDTVPANLFTLMAITTVVGGYHVVASLVFPAEPSEWPDFDLYYDEHNRLVLGFALFAQSCQLALNFVARPARQAQDKVLSASPEVLTVAFVLVFATFPLLIAAYRARNPRTNAIILGVLVAQHVAIAMLSLVVAF